MERVTVRGACNFNYPFSKGVFEDQSLVYHGTCTAFTQHIEEFGFHRGQLPFDWPRIKRLVEICHKVSFRPPELASVGLAAEGHDLDRSSEWNIYFSGSYWEAMTYSRSIGGETVHSAITVGTKFARTAASPELRAEHAAALRRAYPSNPEQVGTWIDRLSDDALMSGLASEVTAVVSYLEGLIREAVPVVYAVSVDPSWFRHPWEPGERPYNARCQKSISPDRVIARATYPDGIEHDWCMGPGPETWDEAVRVSA